MMKRMDKRNKEINQTMETIRDTMVAARQTLVRGNGIINDFAIRLERYEVNQTNLYTHLEYSEHFRTR
ncbi:hypothetical protein ACHAPX_003265 [Trichoderma viride]